MAAHLRPVALLLLGLLATNVGCQRPESTQQETPRSSSAELSPEAPPTASLVASSSSSPAPETRGVRAGDLVFQTSRSSQSRAIQAATRSPLSHMGIVLPLDGALVVYEAVGPVKATPFGEWKARGVDGRILVKRLRRPEGALTAEEIHKLAAITETYLGKPYDSHFEWSDERIYCSELVWKTYKRALGVELVHLERLGDFDLTHPSVVAPLQARYRGVIPRDEPVISPAALATSPLLETVEVL